MYNSSTNIANKELLSEVSRSYKREIYKAMQNHQKNMLKQIKNLKNKEPRMYWKVLNGKKKTNIKASLDDLRDHFKNVYDDDDVIVNNNQNDNDEHVESDPVLDKLFTVHEIKCSIRNIKCGKSAGTDGIVNEYLKHSPDIFI